MAHFTRRARGFGIIFELSNMKLTLDPSSRNWSVPGWSLDACRSSLHYDDSF